jgi:hypothetical protein
MISSTARFGKSLYVMEALSHPNRSSTRCRQAAFRNKNAAPRKPVVAKAATVYQCPLCEGRYLGDQYCNDCGTFCRRLGPGGPCPCCDEPVSVTELLTPDQFLGSIETKTVTAMR